jgi:hypothetical protein
VTSNITEDTPPPASATKFSHSPRPDRGHLLAADADGLSGRPGQTFHVHGLTDAMVPLEGQAFAPAFAQADVFASLALLRATDGCASAPTRFSTEGPLICRHW